MQQLDERDVKIAVMQNEIAGLREQHKAHKEEITVALSNLTEKVFESINGIRSDIKEIYAFINHSKGSIAAWFIAASAFGAVIFSLIGVLINHYFK